MAAAGRVRRAGAAHGAAMAAASAAPAATAAATVAAAATTVAAAATVTAATVLGEHVNGKEGHRKGKARGQRDVSNWRAHRVTLHRQGRLGLCNESTTERLVGTASRCVGGAHTCPPARTKQGAAASQTGDESGRT